MDIWDKRRRNLKALIATHDTNPSALAEAAGLSVNTLSKFLRGETKTLRWSSLEKVCNGLGLANPIVLDADNPFSDSKTELYTIIQELSEDEARDLLSEIKKGT